MDVPMHPRFIFSILVLLVTTLPQSHCEEPDYCKEESYNCGSLSNISYPFWDLNQSRSCGGGDPFELKCHDNDHTTSILIGSQSFTVKEINMTAQSMRLVRKNIADDVCSSQISDTYLDPTLFQYGPSVYNVTIFYNCSFAVDTSFEYFKCGDEGNAIFQYGVIDELLKIFPSLERCERHVQVPLDVPYDKNGGRDFLTQAFVNGFLLNYTVPNNTNTSNKKKKLIIGLTSSTFAGLLICFVVLYLRYKSSSCQGDFGSTRKNNKNIEAFLKNQGALTLKRYTLSDVKKMTNNFKVKLGQGGFGVVYKGKLSNNSLVAVKILNASKKNGEEFMNEVASISKTSHVNVVTLHY